MGNFTELFYKAYADDLVFILKYTQLKRLIKIISDLCPIYNLKLNPKTTPKPILYIVYEIHSRLRKQININI